MINTIHAIIIGFPLGWESVCKQRAFWFRGKRVHRLAGQKRESGKAAQRQTRGSARWLGVHLWFFIFVGNTALLAANLLFEMLCVLPKVTVV